MGRFPFPIPNGWFAVATSAEVSEGEVRNVRYFGRDLVVFRGASGTPSVLDAYCAHLGAHLGVGPGEPGDRSPGPGTVVGDCIACPFHGWRYDGGGQCVEIPYSEARIPARARVRGYPVRELNGLVFAWHHLLDEPPAWELPALAEFEDPEWVGPIYTDRTIATCNQEMMENDVDHVHFAFVHDSPAERRFQIDYREDGRIRKTTEVFEEGREFGKGVTTIERTTTFSRESHQLGFVELRIPDLIAFVAATTPIDEEHVHQRWVFAYPGALGEETGSAVVGAFAQSGIYEDIPIWEHKRYVEHPLLVKGDGPIAEFRRWARQFYSMPPGSDDAGPDAAGS